MPYRQVGRYGYVTLTSAAVTAPSLLRSLNSTMKSPAEEVLTISRSMIPSGKYAIV